MNDAIATYLSGSAYKYKDHIAIILGTGTNSAFAIQKNTGKYVLMNSEWSTADIPLSILTPSDLVALKGLKTDIAGYFELITSGLKFVDIIKEEMRLNHGIDPDSISIDKIRDVFYNNEIASMKDEILKNVVMAYKIRAYKMISGLILASMKSKGSYSFSIVTNGSGLSNAKDSEILEESMKYVLNVLRSHNTEGYHKTFDFYIDHHEYAVLLGSAYIGCFNLENPQNVQ